MFGSYAAGSAPWWRGTRGRAGSCRAGRLGRGERFDVVPDCDQESRVEPKQGEPLMAERVHQRDQVAADGAGVIPVAGACRKARYSLIDRDALGRGAQHRNPPAPAVFARVDILDRPVMEERAAASSEGSAADVDRLWRPSRRGWSAGQVAGAEAVRCNLGLARGHLVAALSGWRPGVSERGPLRRPSYWIPSVGCHRTLRQRRASR